MSVHTQKNLKLELDQLNNYEIDKHSINKYKIAQILMTPFDERSIEYLAELKTYLLQISKLPNKFFIEHIDESSYKKIIDLSLYSCEYKRIKYSNSIIYDINKEASFFYVILEGQVKLAKLKVLQKEMDGNNYYQILLNYRNKKENYLLKKTIDDNFYNFPVDYNDMQNIEKILIKLNLMKLDIDKDSRNSPDYLEYMVKNCGSSLSSFGLESYKEVIKKKNEEIIKTNSKLIKEKQSGKCQKLIEYSIYDARNHSYNNQKILKEKLKYISPDLCRKYNFFLNESYENIIYYEFGEENEITTNDYFGDFENGKYIQRAYSLSDNLELLCMRNDIYKDFIKHERGKIIDSQVGFLLNNFFFEKRNKEHFTRYYFPMFETVNYHMNQIIVKENEKVDYIYFIKSGTVKLISNRSILETHIIIELIKNIFNKNNEEKDINALTNINNIHNYYFKTNLDFLGKEINIKHIKHLITYQSNQCIGFECFYYGVNYLYTAIAMSKEVKIYRIKIKHLIEVLKDKGENSMNDLGKKAEKKINLLLERFNLINNDLMKYYDRKIINTANSNEGEHINKSKELTINKYEENKNTNEHKDNNKLLLIKDIFMNRINNNKSNCIGSESEQKNYKTNSFTRINNHKFKNKFFLSKKIKQIKPNILNVLDVKNRNDFYYSYYSDKKKGFNNFKSLEKQISKKLKMHDSYPNLLQFSNYKLDKTMRSNTTLSSLSPISKKSNQTFLISPPYYKISNNKFKLSKNIKNKFLSKIFDTKMFKDFSFNNSSNKTFKYDFKKNYSTNRKIFKYSIFDYISSPKASPNIIQSLKNQLNITNNINAYKTHKNKFNTYNYIKIKQNQ